LISTLFHPLNTYTYKYTFYDRITTKHELPFPFDCSSPLPHPLVGDTDPQYQSPVVQSSFCGEMGALYVKIMKIGVSISKELLLYL